MAMKVANFNGCKVYNLATGKTMPQWLSDNKKRALAKDEEYRKRLELIQDFEMTTASQCIKMTPDCEHIIVTGTYPPVVRCYTTSDMAMKFQRGLTCEVVTFETLSEDFGKLVFLQSDRTLNFHAPYGTHYSMRVPKFGRDLAYHWETCDLYVAACGDELYRVNLETGQFKEPFTLGFEGCNKIHINPVHQLLGCGGETGICEFWDSRARKAVSKLKVEPNASANVEISALKFDTDGLTLGVGTSNGKCIIYDIRSSTPVYTKEHQYELPVIDVTFHNSSRHIISTDKKVVKIWERHEPTPGKVLTNIETPADINGLHVVSDKRGQSGMLMLAGEQSRLMVYFVPQLGPAPRWCSFLEGLTEELEETAGQSVYEDFKFVTRAEIEELGATGLIGTPMLKGYMHGFFMEMKLYNKLRAVSKPFEYEEHRKKKIQAKIDEKRQSRITAQKRLPKVNRDLAEKMMKLNKNTAGAEAEDADAEAGAEDGATVNAGGAGTKKGKSTAGIIDNRFAALFEREEFERDEMSMDFKLRNPSKGNNTRRGNGRDDSDDELEALFQPVEGVDGTDREEDDDDYDDFEGGDDDDNEDGGGGDSGGDEDSDIEAIRADEEDGAPGRKKKSKSGGGKGKRGRGEDSDEEGQIAKASRIATEKARAKEMAAVKTQAKSAKEAKKLHQGQGGAVPPSRTTAGGRNGASIGNANGATKPKGSGSGSGSGPRMYELTDGASSAKAVFGYTSEMKSQRRAERAMGEIPLTERVKMTGAGGGGASLEASVGKAGGVSGGKVKSVRSAKDGVVKEMSFVPKESKVTPGKGLSMD